MRVELSSIVESDLEAIADYIAQDNPTRDIRFIREIREEFRRVGQNPLHYQLRPEIAEDARLALVGGLRDLVPYRRRRRPDRAHCVWRT